MGDGDVQGRPLVTVINETLAKQYLSDDEPLGKRLLIQQPLSGQARFGPEIAWEVVGVVADERVTTLDDHRDHPGIYVTTEQSAAPGTNLVIRTAIDPLLMQESIRRGVAAVNKDQALADVRTLDQIKADVMASDRVRSLLLGAFALVALLLAAVGIYGVIAYVVVQRTHEIGVRVALGAGAGQVIGLIVRQGLAMTAIGLMLGLVGAVRVSRLLESLLVGIGASDPVTLAAAVGLLTAVAALACYIPARRATNIDPLIALRAQ